MEHVCFDHQRQHRIGMPEAVFCEGKDRAVVISLLEKFNNSQESILFTRLEADIFQSFQEKTKTNFSYDPLSRTAFAHCLEAHKSGKQVGIISAGSADARVAFEAARTLEYFGVKHKVIEDCGVAGLWRLLDKLEEIKSFDVIIAVAGLDAALVSVLGGLISAPIIAVPTSVGYGMAKNGESALSSMLVSCAQGISVMNIGNGYGAACASLRILNLF